MKRSVSKRDLMKFSKVNTHKRKSKERARRELMKLVEATSVGTGNAKIKFSEDGGRAARSSASPHRDEFTVVGVFSGSRGGFGFLRAEEGEDIFIPRERCSGAIDGDTVEVVYHEYRDRYGEKKTEGRVTKILNIGRTHIVGTLCKERRGYGRKTTYIYIIEPDDTKISINPRVTNPDFCAEGNKVLAKLIRRGGFFEATIEESFGAAGSFAADYAAILAEFGIESEFSEDVIKEAREVSKKEITPEGRVDLRDEMIFTIDGEDAKDLDDAISLRKLPQGGWKLGVHIADVSEYVREKTPLDRAAMARGTSVYFTDKVVPMLPKELSNGACSLNAGEDKYALSAIIKLDKNGEIISSEILPTVIRSVVRGVYSEVNSLLSGEATGEIKQKYKSVTPTLKKMHEFYLVLKKKSEDRGALELDAGEAKILLNERGEPTDIIRRERGDGEKMIEQFMLAANEAVATKLTECKIPLVYRVHEEPPEDKLNTLIGFLFNLGFDTRTIKDGEHVNIKTLSKILDESRERGISLPVSYTMLRSMAKAKYSEVRGRHFGLSINTYCHFTSPIRRLSDLATHRIIKAVLIGGKRPEAYASYAKRAAAAATEAELRAIGAERKIDELYKALYLSEKIGEVFPAFVSSVTSFGIFCELENTCEGLVPLGDNGSFVFDEGNLSARVGGVSYKLGDEILIRIEECDLARAKVRFSIVDTF